jgi:hypothetical protein
MSLENLFNLLKEEHSLQQEALRLRRSIYDQSISTIPKQSLEKLKDIEKRLFDKERERIQAQSQFQLQEPNKEAEFNKYSGTIINSTQTTRLLGPQTTKLEATIHLNLEYIPTSIVHLFDRVDTPLITCKVKNTDTKIRRLRVTSYVEGYSAQAIDTLEIEDRGEKEFKQLPTFFPDRIRSINELTRATVNVLVEDLDSQSNGYNGKIEIHATKPIWLLARTTAPLKVTNPQTGERVDMTQYLGAFVTPNAPEVMSFISQATDYIQDKNFVGYQGDKNNPNIVLDQVKALYNALKEKANINYVNSIISNSPEEGVTSQRVRLPRESLKDKQANCLDGTLLFASLLEAISMNPAIVTVPGHAFLGWETWLGSNEWNYLETTIINKSDFNAARSSASDMYDTYKELEEAGLKGRLQECSIRELRSVKRITPME